MKALSFAVLLASSLLLSACEPLERLQASIKNNQGDDSVPVRARKVAPVPVLESLNFNQAVALALRHSLARRTEVLRDITAKSSAAKDASGLPELAAYPRYQRIDVVDEDSVLALETTLEQQRILAEAWDVLDIALAKHSLQRLGSQGAQNHYLRRRALQNITQEVRQFFWAAWIWQQRGSELIELQTRLQKIIAELVEADRQGDTGQRVPLQKATASLNRLQNLERQLRGSRRGLRSLIGPIFDVPLPLVDPDAFDPVTLAGEMSRLNFDKVALLSRPELRNLNGVVSLDRAGTVARLVLGYPQIADWLSGGVEKKPDVSPYRLLKAATHLAGSLLEVVPSLEEGANSETDLLLVSQAVVMQLRLAQQRYEVVRRYAKSIKLSRAKNQATKSAQTDSFTVIQSKLRQFDNALMRVVVRNAEARLGNSISDDVLLNADMQGGLKGTTEIVRMYMNKSVVGAYRSSVRFLIAAEAPVLQALAELTAKQPVTEVAKNDSLEVSAIEEAKTARFDVAHDVASAKLEANAFLNERKQATQSLLEADPKGRQFTLLIGRQGGENAWLKVANWLLQSGVSEYRNRLFVYANSNNEVAVTYGIFEDAINAIHATRTPELQHLADHTHMQVVQIANLISDQKMLVSTVGASGSPEKRGDKVDTNQTLLQGESSTDKRNIFEWRLQETKQWMKTIAEKNHGYTIQLAYRSGDRARQKISQLLQRDEMRSYLNKIYVYRTSAYGHDAIVMVYGFYPGFSKAQAGLNDSIGSAFAFLAPLQIRRTERIHRESVR